MASWRPLIWPWGDYAACTTLDSGLPWRSCKEIERYIGIHRTLSSRRISSDGSEHVWELGCDRCVRHLRYPESLAVCLWDVQTDNDSGTPLFWWCFFRYLARTETPLKSISKRQRKKWKQRLKAMNGSTTFIALPQIKQIGISANQSDGCQRPIIQKQMACACDPSSTSTSFAQPSRHKGALLSNTKCRDNRRSW